MLVFHTHPVLHQPTREITTEEFGTPDLLDLCDHLEQVLVANNALGVAAPQIDVSVAVFCMLLSGTPMHILRSSNDPRRPPWQLKGVSAIPSTW